MRPLHRPMFRYGGPIKEGVMSGIREPHANGGRAALVGNPVYPQTGGREHHLKVLKDAPKYIKPSYWTKGWTNPGTVGGKIKDWFQPKKMPSTVRYGLGPSRVPNTMDKIKNFYRTSPFGKYVAGTPEGKGITYALSAGKGIVPKVAKAAVKSPVGMLGGAYMLDAFPGGQPLLNLDMLGNRNILGQKYDPKTDKRIKGTGISRLWEDKEVKIDDKDKGGKGDESIFKAEEVIEPKKSAEEIRNERIQKYRDIMDIKGMNKEAAYDSLIAASQAINESGDFKGDIKSGKLINQIIQGASKAFDKPRATKDAIDTLILKGEIEKDIKSSIPTEAERAAAAFGISKEEYRNKLLGKNTPAEYIATLSSKATGGKANSALVSQGYKSAGIIPKATIKDTIIDEWMDDNKGKTEIDYVREVISKEPDFVPGIYVVGDRAVITDGTKFQYDY